MIGEYLKAGISIIPVNKDKLPLFSWKPFQTRIATHAESASWRPPIAAVCGEVSGGLVCIDFDDGGSCFEKWGKKVKEIHPEVFGTVYCQKTPSGGYHVVMKTNLAIPNQKLAQKQDKGVLIETRGAGGYFLLAPSAGYSRVIGDITTLQTIDDEIAQDLLDISRTFNEFFVENKIPVHITNPLERNGKSPFDDYDERNTPLELLSQHGWQIAYTSRDVTYLRRPGKTKGISATWNHVPDRFYVFTSSTEFDPGCIYKPSAVYAMLEHGSDYMAAAKQLSRDGYGEKKERKEIDVDNVPAAQILKVSDFRQRIYNFYTRPREAGYKTGLPILDKNLRLDRGFLTVVTGIPTHGKSTFVDFLSMIFAKQHNWKWVVFSPENYPLEIHYHKLAELYHEAGMFGKERDQIDKAIDFIDSHYSFIDATEDDICLDRLFTSVVDAGQSDGFVIDPWNELENTRPSNMNESDFTGSCLRRLRKFSRKYNVATILVAHPTKMRKIKDAEEYPVPSLYDISGSANFYNKADNGIVVYRDFENGTTDIHIKKVKYRNYGSPTGKLDAIRYRFIPEYGGYEEIGTAENSNW